MFHDGDGVRGSIPQGKRVGAKRKPVKCDGTHRSAAASKIENVLQKKRRN